MLTKTFETPLPPGNLLGEDSVREKVRIVLVTRCDGSFTWHVTPRPGPTSARPGKTEAYSLQVTAAGRSRTLRIVVDRGERLDLRDDRAVKGGRLMETASSASGATRRRSCWPQRSCCRSRLRHARRTPAASTTTPPLLRYSCCQVPATC